MVLGAGGGCTVSEIDAALPRNCASLMVTGSDFAPGVVPLVTVALKEKILSPAVTSPFVPLSKNCCAAEPPIRLRSAVTAMPVLGGLVPPATLTVSSVDAPACRLLGFAEPLPAGGVLRGVTVSAMDALALRDCASVMETGNVLPPLVVLAGTVAWKENVLSLAVTSP